jgi:hypothetical protein
MRSRFKTMMLIGFAAGALNAAVIPIFSPVQTGIGVVTPTQTPPAGGVTLQYTGDEGLDFPSPYVLNQFGIQLTFTQTGFPLGGNSFRRVDQVGDTGSTWNGNFAPDTKLLYTNGSDMGGLGPVSIDSNVGILEIAFQAQNFLFGPEVFSLSAFNGNTPLGTFTFAGISAARGDGSATFLGLQATGGDVITRLVIDSNTHDFALGPIDPPDPAPEPATFGIVGVALLGIVLRRRNTHETLQTRT